MGMIKIVFQNFDLANNLKNEVFIVPFENRIDNYLFLHHIYMQFKYDIPTTILINYHQWEMNNTCKTKTISVPPEKQISKLPRHFALGRTCFGFYSLWPGNESEDF